MTRSDTVVILLMIILLLFLFSKFWSFTDDQNNNYAQISISGAPQQKFSLLQDKIINITGRTGISTVQIKNNKIRFTHSPCTKKYCIHSGWLTKTGSIAVCIPNGITVSIKSTKNLFDAINY
ncbi:MAG: NusG domain II-containing protein [Thiohalomonadales bacterium]